MKKFILITCLLIVFAGCEKKSGTAAVTLKGDLHYPWLKFGNFYNQPDSLFKKFEAMKDSSGYDLLYKEDSVFAKSLQVLEERELLKSPFIYMITNTDSIVIVYMNKEQYDPFTKFTYDSLVKKQQKVAVELSASKLYSNLYLCEGVNTVEVVASEEPLSNNKWKKEDYR
jgi:predicted glutamine amidotransferase